MGNVVQNAWLERDENNRLVYLVFGPRKPTEAHGSVNMARREMTVDVGKVEAVETLPCRQRARLFAICRTRLTQLQEAAQFHWMARPPRRPYAACARGRRRIVRPPLFRCDHKKIEWVVDRSPSVAHSEGVR